MNVCPNCKIEFEPDQKCFVKKFHMDGTTRVYCAKCSPVIKMADKQIHARNGIEISK